MINTISNNTEYRNCVDATKGDCMYMHRNEYGVACCSIDHIVQVEFYGCRPIEVIRKKQKESIGGA